MCCKLSGELWILTNIYAPRAAERKTSFLEWLRNINMPDEVKWLMAGHFNLIRTPKNSNKPWGNIKDMFAFNDAISGLRLVEIPFKGLQIYLDKQRVQPSP